VSTVKTLATDQISARQTAGTHRFPQRLAPSSRVYATTDHLGGAPREPIDERSAKPRQTFNRAKVLLIVADVVAVALAVLATYTLEIAWLGNDNGETARFLSVALLSLPAWLVIFTHQRLYNTRFIGRRIDEMRRIVNAAVLGVITIALIGYATGFLIERSALAILFVLAAGLVLVEREVARRIFTQLRVQGRMLRHVIIAGANPEGRELGQMLRTEQGLGYHVIGFVDDGQFDDDPVPGIPLLGPIADTGRILREQEGSSVIVASSGVDSEVTNRLARDLLDQGVHVELSSTLRDISSQRLTVRPLGRFPIVYVEPVVRSGWRAAAKRAFDIAGAGLALVVLSPILLTAAIAIRLDSKGSIFFSQVRVGRDARPFRVLKLRTMVVDAEQQLATLLDKNEADGPLFKIKHDPRITRVGRILRKTSIDELPQLWNVVRGDMSLVGPRPALPHETEAWDSLLIQRLRVKPGITGMWQVQGRSNASFDDYTRLDLYYVDNWSLTTDLAILLKTVPVVALQRGAA
jgi:exopolysaccharide biosynthesis polyprenyl glycosylphosphotransferase